MRKVESDTKQASSTINTAFADIDELMLKAKDVVSRPNPNLSSFIFNTTIYTL